MPVVFCRDPLEPARPDRSFRAEIETAEAIGAEVVLVDHDALTGGEPPARVVRGVAAREEPETAVYRGWMTTPKQYRARMEIGNVGAGDDNRVLDAGSRPVPSHVSRSEDG